MLRQHSQISDKELGLDDMVKGAEAILAFWSAFKSENQEVKAIVEGIQKQAAEFRRATDKSTETAKNGCAFSIEAFKLCSASLDPRCCRQVLSENTSGIRLTSDKAISAASKTRDMFINISGELCKIAEGISPEASARTDVQMALSGLSELDYSANRFANWWAKLDAALRGIASLPLPRITPVGPVRVGRIKGSWEKAGIEFNQFKSKVQLDPEKIKMAISVEEALSDFLEASNNNFDLDTIVKGAKDYLEFITSRNEYQSEQPVVIVVIKSMQNQDTAYYSAIDKSIETAEQGCAFSADAIDLCAAILDPACNAQDLKKHASEMRSTANKAVAAATDACKLFRAIRQELFKISRGIPDVNASIGRGVALPDPATIRLDPKTCDDLRKAIDGLFKLAKSVDLFANWWLNIETALKVIETQSLSGAGPIRVKGIRRRWEVVSKDYGDYKLGICRLRDSH